MRVRGFEVHKVHYVKNYYAQNIKNVQLSHSLKKNLLL